MVGRNKEGRIMTAIILQSETYGCSDFSLLFVAVNNISRLNNASVV